MKSDKSRVLFPPELNEAGSSPQHLLPVADEGCWGESLRSKRNVSCYGATHCLRVPQVLLIKLAI